MAIIALRAWYIPEYEPLRSLFERPHDLRLAKNSLLKSALRADFLDEVSVVRESEWFQRYLAGETIEFYVEGSGSYAIANIDLISHEVYFTKQEALSQLDPTIFFSYQTQQPHYSELIREALESTIAQINRTSRIKLTLEQSFRSTDEPIKLKSTLFSKLKRSLLFIADVSAIAQINAEINSDPPQLIPSPHVCVEVGYALQVKRSEQILLIQVGSPDQGTFPFDLPIHQRLTVINYNALIRELPAAIAIHLERFNLF
ncbi:hypothetical protein Syn7502_03449 [Synechococcus sp. PCC 7502]|uniref:hypothetical protein n=1 Tax=Synechococcus sp. PCC 7502 TaxID=1173263 RepID=UPI00029FB53A|nr:hypothetical protein [Synechococcus sp. PCC 7502]AFY75298.1 hypothetical protein Syn7502_03449 [Synechococcus sp. PCC 7502]